MLWCCSTRPPARQPAMSKNILRRILSPRKETHAAVMHLVEALGEPIQVLDLEGRVLLGEPGSSDAPRIPITVEGNTHGWVAGGSRAELIAELLSVHARKEFERKSLGSELLDAYREMNLLYKLSENLTTSLELEKVANVAVEEAMLLVPSTDGALMLLDQATERLEMLAVQGDADRLDWSVEAGRGLVGQIFQSGKAEIVNNLRADLRHVSEEEILDSLACAPLKGRNQNLGVLLIAHRQPTEYTAADLKRLNTVASQASPAIENALLYAHQVDLTNAYSRFVPREFLSFLGKESIVEVDLGDHVRKDMAIMVSDIRGFTTLSEQMTPRENFDFINRYLAEISPIIRKHRGFIVKYLGDGLMAIFPNGIDDAVEAALEKADHLRRWNDQRKLLGEGPVKIGIGLNVGSMMVGTVGEAARMQGDIISDAVNLTSRLEGLTKKYGIGIAMSGEAVARLRDADSRHLKFLEETQVKGRIDPVAVYELSPDGAV